MKQCFGYIRVSTLKQIDGASLDAQKDAIAQFATRNNLAIIKWFEETETAAKQGRPVFNDMLAQLRKGKATGLIIHKIDRSSRNFHDWLAVLDLPTHGVDVYSASDNLDIKSRSGRLAANIQALFAEDYIFNLKEEIRKGQRGRLKQGYFPWAAPPGYVNNGKGKLKTPCPRVAPLIKQAFALYASRQHSYETLLTEMYKRGLRNTRGGRLTLCGLGNILQNPFYIGLIHMKSSGQTYQGQHEAIVPVSTWKEVQRIRQEKSGPKSTRHGHLFQGIFRCGLCDKPMVPEKQKGHVYYRCKRLGCDTKTIREELLDDAVKAELATLKPSPKTEGRAKTAKADQKAAAEFEARQQSLQLRINDEEARLERLTDLLIDNTITEDVYHEKKRSVELRLIDLRDQLSKLPNPHQLRAEDEAVAELMNNLTGLYEMANRAEKRMIVENVWPNRTVSVKKPAFEPYSWVERAGIGDTLLDSADARDKDRTNVSNLNALNENKKFIEPLFQLLKQYRNGKSGGNPPGVLEQDEVQTPGYIILAHI